MRILACFFVTLALGGCGSSSTFQPDMHMVVNGADMQQLASACGHPGDKGNSLGIGQFCTMPFGECPSGLTCSSITNANLPPEQHTYFCSTTCQTAGPDPTHCGDNALCVCIKPTLCGCTPMACVVGMAG
jgi:hypothetical protein